MARIAGINVPDNKHTVIALQAIYGIGSTRANKICEDSNIKPSVKIKINDRGPYIDGRVLDCSTGVAQKLGFFDQGTANVKIEIIKWGDNKYYKN